MEKGTLEAIDDNVLDVHEREIEGLSCKPKFIGHSSIGHQAIIGVDGYSDSEVIIKSERMNTDIRASLGLNVASEADL